MSQILLIEDHPTNRKLMTGILTSVGNDVYEAVTAESGIEEAISRKPDLIVLDIQLPGNDGLSVVRALRARNDTKHIPFLAVTARAMSGDKEVILGAGCDGYVSKPISYKLFLDEVLRLLERSDGSNQ